MKKLLLASVAVSGLAFAAAPAYAEIDLTVDGYFKGYGAVVDQDETAGTDVNAFDILRDTELHIGGETTLDNGLTVGAHFELSVDQADDNAAINESYVYFSGNWGRVNFGGEDGAGYLLQVAAPSADSNVDGLRQYIQPFATTGGLTSTRLDYDMNPSGKADKLTYLSPIFSGFQVGLTMSPDTDNASDFGGVGTETTTPLDDISETYEIGARYEGQFQNVGVIAGAGYSHGEQNGTAAALDDRKVWNVGLDLDIGPFGIGASYSEDNNALDTGDTETLVVGVDYTTGPFKLGATYFNADTDNGVEFDRYTGGVTYQYGPGMSFRGSIQHLEQDNNGAADADGTALLLGTQINF
tara:strand:- start:1434 stop:2495 length:1062 start_codon:yes stop_codon:yes gene_type:complete